MRVVLAMFGMMLTATQAMALSCLPHSIERTFNDAQTSPDPYVIALGVLDFDVSQLPKENHAGNASPPAETRISATFRGDLLDHNGFTSLVSREITLIAACFGPWCANPPSGKRVLAFLHDTTPAPELLVTPCGGFAFFEPSGAMLRKVKRCFSGGTCVPKSP